MKKYSQLNQSSSGSLGTNVFSCDVQYWKYIYWIIKYNPTKINLAVCCEYKELNGHIPPH